MTSPLLAELLAKCPGAFHAQLIAAFEAAIPPADGTDAIRAELEKVLAEQIQCD